MPTDPRMASLFALAPPAPMLAFLDRPRLPFVLLLVVGCALLGFGLYLQHSGGLEPCPMCILQRYAFTAVIMVALAGAVHGPRSRLARGVSDHAVGQQDAVAAAHLARQP